MSENHYDENCIFCKILKGEIPSFRVYESDTFIVFMDTAPGNKGHSLIVPRKHMATIFDTEDGLGDELLAIQRKVGRAIMTATGATGMNILQNNFRDAGQAVDHIHWHLVPRHAGDKLFPWKTMSYDSMDEMAALAEKIKKSL